MKPFKLIQPATLNHFVDEDIPLTWQRRWARLRGLLPLLCFSACMMTEMGLFHAWLAGRPVQAWIAIILMPMSVMILLFLAIIEVASWEHRRSDRWLKVTPKAIEVSHTKYGTLGMKWLAGILIEPVPTRPDLAKLTFVRKDAKSAAWWRWWSMVLSRSNQLPELRAMLSSGDFLPTSLPVLEVRQPVPPRRRLPYRGLWAAMLAMGLFLHGFPFLAVGLFPPNGQEPRTNDHSRFTAQEREKLGRVVDRHFASAQQYREFLVAVGGGLTALAVPIFMVGLRQCGRWRQDQIEEEQHLLASAGVRFEMESAA